MKTQELKGIIALAFAILFQIIDKNITLENGKKMLKEDSLRESSCRVVHLLCSPTGSEENLQLAEVSINAIMAQ